MRKLPFILYFHKSKLNPVWKTVELLLQIMQIFYSDVITRNDIVNLKQLIREYLSEILRISKRKLKPKEHLITHYPLAIEMNGPIIDTNTIRYEAKHQFFTSAARKTKIFVNIHKSLAVKHQQHQYYSDNNYTDEICPSSKKVLFGESINGFEIYGEIGEICDKNCYFDY